MGNDTTAPTPAASPCPTEELLIAFAHEPTGDANREIEAHLDRCDSCRIIVAELSCASHAADERNPHAMRTLRDGERLSGRYRIVRFIARGGMGEVYEAYDELLSETVALKTLVCTDLDQARGFSRMKSEAQMARRVTHANVCRILEFGIEDRPRERVPFLTMELLRGETLRARVARAGALGIEEARPLVVQMLDALAAIHAAGLVHRDIKSENLFLVDGPAGATKLIVMDFGLARPTMEGELSTSSAGRRFAGTLDYMAPEQLLAQPATAASDVYAVGIVLFELVTGTLPFAGVGGLGSVARRMAEPAPRASSRCPGMPPRWDAAIGRCLQHDPALRFADAEQLRTYLNSAEPPPARARRRVRLWAVASGAIVATIVGIATIGARKQHAASVGAPRIKTTPATAAPPTTPPPSLVEPHATASALGRALPSDPTPARRTPRGSTVARPRRPEPTAQAPAAPVAPPVERLLDPWDR